MRAPTEGIIGIAQLVPRKMSAYGVLLSYKLLHQTIIWERVLLDQ